jgi:hypothetical protein
MSQGNINIHKTTRTVIDTTKTADGKRLTSLCHWSGTPSTGNVSTEDNRPATIHNKQNNQITTGCKAENYIHRSTAAQRERRPRASEKRQHLLPSQDIEKVQEKPLNSTSFFFLLCGIAKEGEETVQGQHYYHIALDEPTQSKAKGNFYKKNTTTKQQQGTRTRHLPLRSERTNSEQGQWASSIQG